ncbi:MAG: type IV secretion system protein VirB11 [Glomeribacter sp. 1016415]|nr:type IV secretion system protein VirB11 [Glomeribacter sp. 1016415]
MSNEAISVPVVARQMPDLNAMPQPAAKDSALLQLLRPFKRFLDDPTISELAMNRALEVLTRTRIGWLTHPMPELTASYMQALITAIVVYNGLPMKSLMYAILPGGQRVTIGLPPAVINHSLMFLIRKQTPIVKSLIELEAEGTFDRVIDVSFHQPSSETCTEQLTTPDFNRLEPFEVELLELKRNGTIRKFLEASVQYQRNIIIAGKTSSGKTTFARSLIEQVPTSERIATIEDVHELFLPHHPNVIALLYGQGTGRVSADECIAACMRATPDRIFLAELRGDEAWEYLMSLNTGHPGSITTTHANGALQTFERIATLIKKSSAGQHIGMEMIKQVLYTTIDIVLFVKDRQLTEIFYDPIFAKAKRV